MNLDRVCDEDIRIWKSISMPGKRGIVGILGTLAVTVFEGRVLIPPYRQQRSVLPAARYKDHQPAAFVLWFGRGVVRSNRSDIAVVCAEQRVDREG